MTSMDAEDADTGSVFDHAAFRTGISTIAGYTIILLVMFAILFLVPYAVFAMLG